ncbi:hypothetical protein ARMGADRAFT_1040531 [Armillaria gallica]|uniref:Uncharacterized protein n=1 Tax=Armillaria gallica TaxID=47427 RepID=A0A2H3CD77_ARMGA|nr:hypothetical protein ARMGADRAFT_1040531 [Armillaria gallica]
MDSRKSNNPLAILSNGRVIRAGLGRAAVWNLDNLDTHGFQNHLSGRKDEAMQMGPSSSPGTMLSVVGNDGFCLSLDLEHDSKGAQIALPRTPARPVGLSIRTGERNRPQVLLNPDGIPTIFTGFRSSRRLKESDSMDYDDDGNDDNEDMGWPKKAQHKEDYLVTPVIQATIDLFATFFGRTGSSLRLF